jgi:hypothetical protein
MKTSSDDLQKPSQLFVCSICNKGLAESHFHKNASRLTGLDHSCKDCVSTKKRVAYKRNKKKERERTKFRSTVVGGLSDEAIEEISKILGPAIKEWCVDEDCA